MILPPDEHSDMLQFMKTCMVHCKSATALNHHRWRFDLKTHCYQGLALVLLSLGTHLLRQPVWAPPALRESHQSVLALPEEGL